MQKQQRKKKNYICFGLLPVCSVQSVDTATMKRRREEKKKNGNIYTHNITNDQKTAIIHTTKVIMIIMPMSIFFFSSCCYSFCMLSPLLYSFVIYSHKLASSLARALSLSPAPRLFEYTDDDVDDEKKKKFSKIKKTHTHM